MGKPFPALCRDCKHGIPEEDARWNMRCTHPKVNAKNAWALANTGGDGMPAQTDARHERSLRWFAPCGMKGKLWEPKCALLK